jgi:hypothetical protein
MSQEIFKTNYTKYYTTLYRDSNPIDINPDELRIYSRNLFVESSNDDQELTYQSNLSNPLASVTKSYMMVVIERKDSKLSLKVFNGSIHRRSGNNWFKISKNVDYLTLNLDKGDVYFGHLYDYQKKRKFKRRVRRNFFSSDPIQSIKLAIINLLPLGKDERISLSNTILNIFLKEIDGIDDVKSNFKDRLYKFYLKSKGIKYPNNYITYFRDMGSLPKMKTLRKFDMKLVDAFMYEKKLKGDVIKKVLHDVKGVRVDLIQAALDIFPVSLILQDVELVKELFENITAGNISFNCEGMSKKEIKNFFSCFRNSIVDSDIDFWTLRDHTEMYTYLKNVGENIKWTSFDTPTFREEHLDWTDKCDFYKRGYYTRIYPISLDLAFKIPIIDGDDVYYPIILKESDEYNEESKLQQNCVKTYIGRPSSLIISLRKNSTISTERATVEYQIFKKDEIVTFNRPQSLGKYNSRLDESWNEALKSLDQMMESWIGNGENFETVRLEKVLENNQKLYSGSEWSENGFLFWTYNVINKSNQTYNFFI